MIEQSFLVDRAAAGNPVRVCIVGPGFMGRALIRHLAYSASGIKVAAVVSRSPARAMEALSLAQPEVVATQVADAGHLDELVSRGQAGVTTDVSHALDATQIDVVVDATGALEYGAKLALAAIDASKPLVTLNAEVEATVGPILDLLAHRAGVTRTVADGDQPGVQLRLAAFATSVGIVPRVLGNIKGLQDVRRNPSTQQGFAARWKQNANMVTSFADGTKISFEQAVVANIVGFGVQQTGMLGRDHVGHIDALVDAYDLDALRALGGVVDYVVGAQPAPGVYCLGEAADPVQAEYLELFKLGRGPLYALYAPYHLCHLEVPRTIALVAGFGTGLGNATGGPRVEVCTVAKTALDSGTVLDGLGGFHAYGQAMNADEFRRGGFVPMGIAPRCRLRFDVAQDHVLTYDDVELPAERVIDQLRTEQARQWS